MKVVEAAFNQEKALVRAFSVITNLRMELFEALPSTGERFHWWFHPSSPRPPPSYTWHILAPHKIIACSHLSHDCGKSLPPSSPLVTDFLRFNFKRRLSTYQTFNLPAAKLDIITWKTKECSNIPLSWMYPVHHVTLFIVQCSSYNVHTLLLIWFRF